MDNDPAEFLDATMRIFRRPSPALVISILALAVACTGSASAHTVSTLAHKISGSTLKAHSVAGSRLKNNTVTGKQIKESTLGTVPKAKSASTLSGIPATGFLRPIAVRVIKTTSTPGNFAIVALPGLGVVDGDCTTGAGLIVTNTTAVSQDMNATFTDEASGSTGSNVYDFHGPLGAHASVTHGVPGSFSLDLEGLTTGTSPRMVRLSVTANVILGNCIFDAVGESTL